MPLFLRPVPLQQEIRRTVAFTALYYLLLVASFAGDSTAIFFAALAMLLPLSVSVLYIARHQPHRAWHGGRLAILWGAITLPWLGFARHAEVFLMATIFALPEFLVCAMLTWTWLPNRNAPHR